MSAKLCSKCGKEQVKKFSKQCSFCGASIEDMTGTGISSTKDSNSDRFSLNRQLLETMVILASIDGRIGENELETLINFTCRLGKIFAGFETRTTFASLVAEVQPLGCEEKFRRLRANGELFKRAYSAEFNSSFISDFEAMIMADGKISENEERAIKELKDSMIAVPKQEIKEEKKEEKTEDRAKKLVSIIIDTGVLFALSDGELHDEEAEIISRIALLFNNDIVNDMEEIKRMFAKAIVRARILSGSQKISEIKCAGEIFAMTLGFEARKALIEAYKSIIYADGVVDDNEEILFKALVSTMFPEID